MKLHQLETKNLNSLYGEQKVDLENELGGAPLFLILGPTGSGKSTLMDAISLALFGQTPRLTNARGQQDTDPAHVMSRGTGEAWAKLVFSKREEKERRSYRATWYCSRARRKPDGKLQAPRRTLERLDPETGEWQELVSSTIARDFQPEFDRVLEALTVKDFQRSMLLAQGEFAAFLKADERERAAILERLTNTSEYQEIGRRAAARFTTSKAKVDEVENQLKGISVPTPEQEAELRGQLEALVQQQAASRAAETRARTLFGWRTTLDGLVARVAEATGQEQSALAGREARREELEALAEHERCSVAGAALGELVRVEGELARLEADLPKLRADEAALRETLARLEQAQAGLRVRRDTSAADFEAKKPEIGQARQLRSELKSAEAELKKAVDRHGEAEKERKALGETEAASVAAAGLAARQLETAKQTLAAAEPARPLLEELQALRNRHEALAVARKKAGQLLKAQETTAKAVEELEAKLAPAAQAALEASAKAAEARVAEQAARAALEAELAGAADARARRAAIGELTKKLSARKSAADEIEGLEADRRELDEKRAKAEAEVGSLQGAIAELGAALAAKRGERDRAAARVAEARERAEHLRWKQSTAKLRSQLRLGEPCPLCGGTDHPAAEDPRLAEADRLVDEEVRAAEEAQRAQESELAGAEASLAKAAQQEAAARGGLEPKQAAAAQLKSSLEKQLARLAVAAGKLGLCPPVSAEALAGARAATAAEESKLEAQLEKLEAADAAATAALKGRGEAESAAERLRTADAQTRERLEGERQRFDERRIELEQLSAEGEAERASLVAALAARAVPVAPEAKGEALKAALEEAERRVAALKSADEACLVATRNRDAADGQVVKARAAREASDGKLAAAAGDLAARRQRVEELKAAAAGPLGGADPEEVERRLSTEARKAQQEWEEGEKRLGTRREEHAAAATRAAEAGRLHAEREQEKRQRTETLAAQLEAIGLPDRKALESRLLPEPRRAELSAVREQVERAVSTARTTLADRARALDEHRAVRPEGFDETSQTAELLRTELEAAQAKLAEDSKQLGKLEEAQRAQADARAKAGKLQETIAQAKREHAVWERLHRLIGVADGEHFKLFAQLLNLQDLIGKANDHLRRLAPRYTLVPGKDAEGKPRLSFAVRDAYHADDERPLSTLSGGETFLTSLSLALALADYRTVRMPIETLLLDEGFGTLDPETLQVAMNALTALNAAGTQVGIISHVEGLKERIDARIVVERQGNGRSSYRAEVAGSSASVG